MYKSVSIQYNHHGVVCQLLRQYRACVVDSVLWYIHRQACLSMITNTLHIHMYIHNKLCTTLCVCSPSHPYLVSSLFTPSLYSQIFFLISSTEFSTINLPNLEIFDNVPSKIFLETIAKGVTGRMNINLGEIAEVHVSGYYAENKLRIEPLTSLALIDLLSILPDMETVIDSLPPVVMDITNAKITRFIYTPASGIGFTHNLFSSDITT